MIKSGNVADVGPGPGLPGIPLAIVKPEVQFTLIDTNAKRVRFLHQLIHALGLKNAQAVHTRIEKHHPQPGYDQIISRAFSQIKPMVELTLHALADNGELLAMKGVFPEQEMGELTNMEVAITQIQPIKVPFLDAERHLVVLKKRNISD
jgi:16S rRNA (guanine527-N7)-methyltransferase